MKAPGFAEGVGVALVGSLFGSAAFAALTWLLAGVGVLRLVVAGLAFGYVIYLMIRSPVRSGRIVVLSSWSIVALSTWLLVPPLGMYVLVHVLLIWLVRSLYFYNSVLPAFLDLLLNGLALILGMGVTIWTSSLFLGIWTFFLLQALFISIPNLAKVRTRGGVVFSSADNSRPREG